jgi:hypothetical protein
VYYKPFNYEPTNSCFSPSSWESTISPSIDLSPYMTVETLTVGMGGFDPSVPSTTAGISSLGESLDLSHTLRRGRGRRRQ